jgi:hypothetical protein
MPILDHTAVHRVIIVNANRRDQIRNFVRNYRDSEGINHLDPLGGGGHFTKTELALLGDPDDGSIVRSYAVGWWLPQAHWVILRDWFQTTVNWKVNTTDADNDISHYNSANWTWPQILADTTKKRFAVKVVPVEFE